MKIQYFGHSCFFLKNKEVSVLMDPFDSEMVGFQMPKVEADIVTVSHQHKDHNYVAAVLGQPVIFDFPGEYEAKGVKIFGYQSYHDHQKGKERGENIIFKVVINGVKVTHLGDLGHIPGEELVNELEDTDILLIPVGGTYTFSLSEAKQTIELLKPSVTIPMHFKTPKHNLSQFQALAPLSEFLELMGQKDLVGVNKLEFKTAEDLPESELIVLDVVK